MARLNARIKSDPIFTHESGKATKISPRQQLERLVMANMLWEDTFYVDGKTVADQIKDVIPKVKAELVSDLAVRARTDMKLRHVPLLLVREMARIPSHKSWVADTLSKIIQRPDELTEFLAIYWKDGRTPLSAQVKKGLARAFAKFDEYALAKYNRPDSIKLRDVLFMVHPNPQGEGRGKTAKAINKKSYSRGKVLRHEKGLGGVFKRLVEGTLETPDTWEVELSAGKGVDKKESWERLLKENKLGALALIRNLRNFQQTGVDEKLVFAALDTMRVERVLPFRFIAAARYVPRWEHKLEAPMLKCLAGKDKLGGKTALVIDVSGSMDYRVSDKSDINRLDAAAALAILLREICEDVNIITFSNRTVTVPARRGFALRDAIIKSQPHGGTNGNPAIQLANKEGYNRIIVLTDEQWVSSAQSPLSGSDAYFINMAAYKNGIGYGEWNHIDGWSEAVIDYIQMYEKNDDI